MVSTHCFLKVKPSSRTRRVVEAAFTLPLENELLDKCQSKWTQTRWCLEVSTCTIHTWCSRCWPTQVFRRSFQCKLNKHLSLELIRLLMLILAITILHMGCQKQGIRLVTIKTNSIKCMVCQVTHKTALSLQRTIWNRNKRTSKWATSFRTMKWCLVLLTWRSW